MLGDVIVIGSGMAGATVAHRLRAAGASVIVLDKARGSGGRMSSKRVSLGGDLSVTVDLGCPAIEAKSPDFQDFLKSFIADGLLTKSSGAPGRDSLAVRGRSSALTRTLIGAAEVRFSAKVLSIRAPFQPEASHRWEVVYEQGGKTLQAWASHVVITAPPEQAQALLPEDHVFRKALNGIHLVPQWVCALVFSLPAAEHSDRQEDVVTMLKALARRVAMHPGVETAIVENEKPGRTFSGNLGALTVHFAPGWSQVHIDEAKDRIARQAQELVRLSMDGFADSKSLELVSSHVHRWLYSQPGRLTLADQRYLSGDEGLSLCGDYFGATEFGGLERAFLSASALSEALQSSGSLSRASAHA